MEEQDKDPAAFNLRVAHTRDLMTDEETKGVKHIIIKDSEMEGLNGIKAEIIVGNEIMLVDVQALKEGVNSLKCWSEE